MKQINFTDLPFIGRKNEISLLNVKIDSAFSSKGKCMLIIGEPGIGKSRLISEFLAQLKKTVIALHINLQPGMSKPRDIAVEVIRSYLRSAVHSSKVITRIIDPAMYREFKRSIPELDTYYPFEMESMDPAGERPDIKEMFHRFLNKLSSLAPIALAIDGFDHLDEDGHDMVEYLLPNIPVMPMFLALVGQDLPEVQQWLERIDSVHLEKMMLRRLDGMEISQINQLLFQNSLDRDFIDWIAGKTGGLPLFLKEFLYALFEKGVVFYESEHEKWRVIESYSRVKVPDRIEDMIMERLNRLSKPEIDFLKAASITREEFDARSPLLRTGETSIPSLVRAGFIQKRTGKYAFSIPLIRDLLYDGITADKKEKMHRAYAGYYEKQDPGAAAQHYVAAGVQNVRVVELLAAAAIRSRMQGAYDRSIDQLEQALEIAGAKKKYPSPKLFGIYLELCTSLFLGEKYQRLHELSEKIEKYAKKKPVGQAIGKLGAYYSQLIQSLLRLGKYKDALDASQKALVALEKEGVRECDETRYEIAVYQAFICRDMGQLDRSLAMALNLNKMCEDKTSVLSRHNICKLLGSIYNEKKEFLKAIEFREQALAAAKQTGIDHLIAAAQGNLGVSMTSAGLLSRGMEFMRMYQGYNISAGRIRAEIVSYIHMAQIFFNQGYIVQAEAEYKKGMERIGKHGGYLKETLYELHYRYGTLLVMSGNYPDARRHLEISMKLAQEMKNPVSVLYSILNLGFIHAAQKDKAGLSRIVSDIKNNFKGKYESEVSFDVLEGFQSIFSGHTKVGLLKIDDALTRLERQQATAGLFRLFYLCGTYLKSNKNTVKQAGSYLKKAMVVAEKYQMTGWLKTMIPDTQESIIEPLCIHCLGSLRIEHPQKGQVDIDQLQRVKPSQLLAILVCGALTKVRYTRERIGSLLWPDLPPAKMVNNFHVCLFQLKEHIGSEYIKYTNGNYIIEHAWFDAQEFKNMINKADVLLREGKIHSAEETYETASELYAGDFLEDLYDPWIDDIRAELKALRISRLLALGEIFVKKLKFEQAIKIGQDVLKSDALSEEGHRFLIKCYMLNGEKAKAANQYNKCIELFRRELDCEPSEETLSLRDKIK